MSIFSSANGTDADHFMQVRRSLRSDFWMWTVASYVLKKIRGRSTIRWYSCRAVVPLQPGLCRMRRVHIQPTS